MVEGSADVVSAVEVSWLAVGIFLNMYLGDPLVILVKLEGCLNVRALRSGRDSE